MKNKMMRVAVIMMALVLVTSCFVGGTFAKYTTAGTGTDTARVAKFGVTVNATEGDGAFTKTYTKTDSTYTLGDVTVSAEVDVVAPGTNGTFATFDMTGTPEVAVRVTYAATVTVDGNWVIDHDEDTTTADVFYCPITVNVGGTDICGLDYTAAADFAKAIKDAIDAKTQDFAPGTDLSTQTTDDLAITWAWAFTGATGTINQTDVADTVLGDAANANIQIDVTVTVDQID